MNNAKNESWDANPGRSGKLISYGPILVTVAALAMTQPKTVAASDFSPLGSDLDYHDEALKFPALTQVMEFIIQNHAAEHPDEPLTLAWGLHGSAAGVASTNVGQGPYVSYEDGKIRRGVYESHGYGFQSTVGVSGSIVITVVWGGVDKFAGNSWAGGVDIGTPIAELSFGFQRLYLNGSGERDLVDAITYEGRMYSGVSRAQQIGYVLTLSAGFGLDTPIDLISEFGTTKVSPSSETYFADVDGDGAADAITVFMDFVVVRRSNGGTFAEPETWIDHPYHGNMGEQWVYFSDVTGDGMADAIVVNGNGVTVRPSTGDCFSANETWTPNAYYGSRGTFFADVTGDGKADAIVVNDDGVTVRPSTGVCFSWNETWTDVGYYGSIGTYFADVTGDGMADAIVVNANGVTVRRSDGTKFKNNEKWTTHAYYGSLETAFADVTGDGKADAIVVNSNRVSVRPSTGSRFYGVRSWTRNAYFGSSGERAVYFADTTGDATADAIVINDVVTVRPSSGGRFTANQQWTE